MTKKPPRNTNKELLAQAAAGPLLLPDDYDPDGSDEVFAFDIKAEREWYESRGYEVPEEYAEGYDPLDKDDQMEGWVEDKEHNPVRIISPKNAKHPE